MSRDPENKKEDKRLENDADTTTGNNVETKQKSKPPIGSSLMAIATTASAVISLGFFAVIGYGMLQQRRPLVFPGYGTERPAEKTVALVPIKGAIASGGGTVVGDNLVSLLGKAERDGVDAYVFEIDSGGGEVLPSKEIMEKVMEVSRDKYTVALIRSVGASGAYWIASACDKIIADETSFVGSIGVRMDYLQFKGLLDKMGIKHESITGGEHKGIGSPYKELTPAERKILDGIVNEAYALFVNSVAENRNIPVEKVRELATGQIYTGKQAFENGLVDQLGGREEVSKDLENGLGSGFKMVIYYEPPQVSLFGSFVSTFGKSIGEGIAENIGKDAKEQEIDYKF